MTADPLHDNEEQSLTARSIAEGSPLDVEKQGNSQNTEGEFSPLDELNGFFWPRKKDDTPPPLPPKPVSAEEKEAVRTVARRFQWKGNELTPAELRQVDRSQEAVAAVVDVPVSFISQKLEYLTNKLPLLSGKEPDLAEALFTPNEHGATPLDNPNLWDSEKHATAALDNLRLTDALLARRTEKGSGLLDAAIHAIPAGTLIGYLHKRGVQAGAEELLDSAGKPNEFFTVALANSKGRGALFSDKNWRGKTPKELTQVYQAVPDESRQHIRYHTLKRQLSQGQGKSGVGR